MDLFLLSLTNKAFPFPIFSSVLPSLVRFLLFSSLLFSSSFVFPLPTQQPCIEDHFSALLHLKQGFYFFCSKTSLSSWSSNNTDCCSWEGITCDVATGHVISLDLSSLIIYGRVDSESLFRLQSLQRLNLGDNNFDPSPIPSGFDKLTSLTHLNLSRLSLYGQIPIEISRLTSLVSLDLSHNGNFNISNFDFRDMKLENPNIGVLVQNLSSLRELYLDSVSISVQGIEWGLALSSALPRLRKLSLRNCHLSGPIHSSLSQLRFLSELDLSENKLSSAVPNFTESLRKLRLSDCGLSGPIHSSLSKLHFLSELDLSRNSLYTVVPNIIGNFSSLTSLHLTECGLHGKFPESIFLLPNLRILHVSRNPFLTGYLPEFPPNNSLQQLDLSDTGFSGKLPESLGNLKLLTRIDLRYCNLSGQLPSSLTNLSSIIYLSLGFNSFSGPFPSSHGHELRNLEWLRVNYNLLSGTIPSSLFSLPSLQVLGLRGNQFSGELGEFQNVSSSPLADIDLQHNNLEGLIPRSIFELTKLTTLSLSSNNFSGVRFHHTPSSPLQTINLDNNNLQGPLPRSFFELSNLNCLTLSSNNLSGIMDLGLFRNLKNLVVLDLSGNNFSISDGGNNSTSKSFPQIRNLRLRSCNIRKFPIILRNYEKLDILDLSNNQIHGEIPKWIWKVGNMTLSYLNLSHNALEGLEGPFHDLSLSYLEILDLGFNKLKGSILIPPPHIYFFSLSSNNLGGEVPLRFCSYTSLKVLDLSNNRFNGLIPPCLGDISDALIVLNLGGNAFHGTFLQTFKEGCKLETLDVSENQLEGQLPRSLAKCKMLEVLNFGNNQIQDTFPFWLENLSQLRILIMRSNKFHGTIGYNLTNYTFPLLQIIDLSSNSFMGSLPSNLFRSWKGMMEVGKSQSQFLSKGSKYEYYYQDTVTIVSKGLEMKLVKILIAFTVVDLSNNKFQGDIIKSVGDLRSLIVLNISYNHLTGRIPSSLGNLRDLESLDLSQNNLTGEIPQQLTKLTFLAVLNLSQNQLVGSIPQSQQFLTFTSESFQGNLGLCGPPLLRKCGDAKVLLPSIQLEGKYDWRSVWMGFGVGYGVGMGILFWTLALWTKGMREYILFIDRMLLLIFPCEAFGLVLR